MTAGFGPPFFLGAPPATLPRHRRCGMISGRRAPWPAGLVQEAVDGT
jgi:hypothetical protein